MSVTSVGGGGHFLPLYTSTLLLDRVSHKKEKKKQNIHKFILFVLLYEMATIQKTSAFYWACRNGDVDTVKEMLPKLKANDINRIESNGSTALHAASYYSHTSIVRLLLERGANTTIRNKYKKTAKEEASTDEGRSVFESTAKTEESDDDEDEDVPQSKFVQIYLNKDNIDQPMLATRILKARLGTYTAHEYTISAGSNLEQLEKKYRILCEKQYDQWVLRKGEEYFKKYRDTGDFDYMIKLYTDETPFYTIVHDDETYLVEIYQNLLLYDKYSFQGQSFRGACLLCKDLEPYEWAKTHPKSLLEICKLTSTSTDPNEALRFTGYNRDGYRRVLFKFDFGAPCFTAINVSSLSEFEDQKEVIVLSGSFFKVSSIHDDDKDKNLTIISLENIPADKNALSAIN
jgi:hypothetical protein